MADTSWLDDAPDAAWLDEAPDAPGSAPGAPEAVSRGFAQGGTLGFADEFVGAARALGPKGGSGQDFANDAPIVEPVQGDTFAERYRTGRDEERAANAAAQEAQPIPFFLANLAGGAALAPALPAPTGGSLGARVASGAKTAAPAGAAYGAGGSEAEDLRGIAGDAAIGGAGGAALGAAVPLVMGGVQRAAVPFSEWLRGQSIAQGRKVLTGNAGTISVKKPLPDEVVEEAIRQGAIRPLGTTQRAADVLREARETVGQRYADIIDALEARGVTGPVRKDLAARLMAEADAIEQQTLGSPKPGLYRAIAEELIAKAQQPGVASGRLGLRQAENMKRGLQREAATEYDKLLNQMRPTGEAKVGVASAVRQAIEDAVAQQAAKAPDEAAAFEPVKAQLSRIIEGGNAADTAAARMSRNRGISLSDTVAAAAGGSAGGFKGAALLATLNKIGRERAPATLSWLASKGAGVATPLSRASMSPAAEGEARAMLTPEIVEWLRARFGLSPAVAGAEGDAP